MNYYYVKPEVAGGWGRNTVFDRAPGSGTVVHQLHYVFEDWFGDALITSSPCFIVTEPAAIEIRGKSFTGVTFDKVEVSTSEQFKLFHPDIQLPRFIWLKISGEPSKDDFGLVKGHLVVSQRALDTLKGLGLSNAKVMLISSEIGPQELEAQARMRRKSVLARFFSKLFGA